jgi:lipoprotein LpqH
VRTLNSLVLLQIAIIVAAIVGVVLLLVKQLTKPKSVNPHGVSGAPTAPGTGLYPDTQGSGQPMPTKPRRRALPWWLSLILCLIFVVAAGLTLPFFNYQKIFNGGQTGPGNSAALPPGASAPAGPAPSGGNSPSAGSVRIIIDGQEQPSQGTVWCAENPPGQLGMGVGIASDAQGGLPPDNLGVRLAVGPPLVVNSVVYSNNNSVGQNWALGFPAYPETGQASATQDGNTYTITGTAQLVTSPTNATMKSFEIDLTCPSTG